MIVWQQVDGVEESLWARRYDAAACSWQPVARVACPPSSFVSRQRVALDDDGNATAVWEQVDDGHFGIRASRYDVLSNQWGESQALDESLRSDCWRPQVAMASNCQAVVVWQQSGAEGRSVWASLYSAAQGNWRSAQRLVEGSTGTVQPQCAMGSHGNVMVTWQESLGDRQYLAAAHYECATLAVVTGWSDQHRAPWGNPGFASDGW